MWLDLQQGAVNRSIHFQYLTVIATMSPHAIFSICFVLVYVITSSDSIAVDPGYGLHYVAAPVKLRQAEREQHQDLSKVPGTPGVDYPLYHSVPHTKFSCHNVPAVPGMYANVETGCQAYHICHDGREGSQGASFLCTNGTLFNQKEFSCDWWYNVNCHDAINQYRLNLDPHKNPYVPKKKPEDQHLNYVAVALPHH